MDGHAPLKKRGGANRKCNRPKYICRGMALCGCPDTDECGQDIMSQAIAVDTMPDASCGVRAELASPRGMSARHWPSRSSARRQQYPQEAIETSAFAEGLRLGMSRNEVCHCGMGGRPSDHESGGGVNTDSDRFPNFGPRRRKARQSGASERGHRDHEAKNGNGEAGKDRDASGEPGALDIWDAGDDDYNIPPREWLLGNTFCKKFLSSLIADGGVGKTALRIAQIGSLATGRSITGEHVFRRCRALILSFEDDRDELRRRVYAAMLKHGSSRPNLKAGCSSPRQRG